MDKKDNEYMQIFSQRLAGYLMFNGFVLGNMRPDSKGGGKNIFFFKNSPEIRGAIEKYKTLKT